MAQANVDPVELRRFASDLNRFNGELQALMSGLHGRLRGLENTWRDQEQRRFTEVFEQTMKVLNVFLENSHLHASFLSKKAAAIEAYLKQR
ncbi:MAG TPA: WXG100 family type VII secretion target [Tepidisphaeraceae bacterium]|nr:WXG100 family type VII secretion target [Tepidisphaeraceae bacterium]